ncbi:rod shape-determining protein MreC [Sphingomonas sp.]|uniref:rod shape-determining protein MreC n=1 Tax=Sphingomonas sp. TaxID=28214 RepID=UPI003D6D2EEB
MAPSRNRRPGFSRRAQYGLFLGYVIAVAGAIVAVILLVLARLNPPAFAPMRATIAEVTTPVSSGLAGLGRGIASIPAGIGNHFTVMQKNATLRKELEANRALLLRARTLSYDNHRLKTLLHLRERVADPVVAARLVSSSAASTRRYAVLNAGSWQGVRIGQPVRGPEGLIGRILETGPNTARVLLITDPESIVPVRRTRDGLPALAAGRGDGMIDVRSVMVSNAAFEAGDVFVTSGTGGIYSPNIPVARIVRRSRDTALARSFAQPDTLDFALVQQGFMPIQPPAPPATANAPTNAGAPATP